MSKIDANLVAEGKVLYTSRNRRRWVGNGFEPAEEGGESREKSEPGSTTTYSTSSRTPQRMKQEMRCKSGVGGPKCLIKAPSSSQMMYIVKDADRKWADKLTKSPGYERMSACRQVTWQREPIEGWIELIAREARYQSDDRRQRVTRQSVTGYLGPAQGPD